jgi:N6-adenosine-specific RNA methylase IME4
MIFRTVQLDPPWLERGGGKSVRGAQRHYPLLPTPKILEVVSECPYFQFEENAHCFLWVTDNFLKDGLWLMDNLGFEFKRTFQWIKVKGKPKKLDFETGHAVDLEHPPHCATKVNLGCDCGADVELRYGIGQYARGAHEMMLFGTRGKGQDESVFSGARNIPSAFFAPVPRDADNKRIHSRKPDAAYELIEARSKGPYLEVFARRNLPNWTSWGLEVQGSG